jgi:hypothetical protein
LAPFSCLDYNTGAYSEMGGPEYQKIAGLSAPSRQIFSSQTPGRPSIFARLALTSTPCSHKIMRLEIDCFHRATGSGKQGEKSGNSCGVGVCLESAGGNHEEGLSPLGLCVAVRGGANEKAPSRGRLNSYSGLGPWQPCGPRRFARQDFTPQAVGSDSRAVHPHILTWAYSAESILGNQL